MPNLGEISQYLGMEVDVETKKISWWQTNYLKKILDRFQITECKPTFIPVNLGKTNSLFPSEYQADQATINLYQSAIVTLLWLIVYI